MGDLGLTELPSRVLQSGIRWAVLRFPRLRLRMVGVLDQLYRVVLFPFRRPRRRGVAEEQQELVGRTAPYNEAAERYYAEYPDPSFLLNKPFGEPRAFAKHLIDLGTLVAATRLRPGDTVMEFGAGSCWASHFLNRFGCRTIAVDVSPTALALGKRLFESDPRTDWSLTPRFLPYDGHTIPLDDAVCDRIIINDAFHHIPNQREILGEMLRLLGPDGMVAMSEPGAGHGDSQSSLAETAATGVLENELVVEDVAALAEAVGFHAAHIVPTSPLARHEIPARDLGRFTGGKGFASYWHALSAGLTVHHYILLYKGGTLPTTARPSQVVSTVEIIRPTEGVTLQMDETLRVTLRLTNRGDTRWLETGAGDRRRGWTRVGVHLFNADAPTHPVNFDWFRAPLGTDIDPGETLTLDLALPALRHAGNYLLTFEPVIEGTAWFSELGTTPARLTVTAIDRVTE